MKRINFSFIRLALVFVFLMIKVVNGNSQTTFPEILNNGTLKEQLDYIEERTRIYENYRAIREDMFQKIKDNVNDSVSSTKMKVFGLLDITLIQSHNIDSLIASLEMTNNKLNDVIATKNSITLFGLEVNKLTYNAITWMIVAGLLFILVVGFLAFKRNLAITKYTKKELEELKNEFEAYRQSSREAREKMTLEHFNELKKLKGQ